MSKHANLIAVKHSENKSANSAVSDLGDKKLASFDSGFSAENDVASYFPRCDTLDSRIEQKIIQINPEGGATSVAYDSTNSFNLTGFDWLERAILHFDMAAMTGVACTLERFANIFRRIYFQSASGDMFLLPEDAYALIKQVSMNAGEKIVSPVMEGDAVYATRTASGAGAQHFELDLTDCKFFLDGIHALPCSLIISPKIFVEIKPINFIGTATGAITGSALTGFYLECHVRNDRTNSIIPQMTKNQQESPFLYPIYQYFMTVKQTAAATAIRTLVDNVNSQSVKGIIVHAVEDATYHKVDACDLIPDAGSTIIAGTDTYQILYDNLYIVSPRYPLSVDHNVYIDRKDIKLVKGNTAIDGYPILYIDFSKEPCFDSTIHAGHLSLSNNKPLEFQLNLGSAPTSCILLILVVCDNYMAIKNGICNYYVH